MNKLIMSALGATAVFGLSACGEKADQNNMAIENFEDLNAGDDMNMDMNATDMNMGVDMNATDLNAADANTATGNSEGY